MEHLRRSSGLTNLYYAGILLTVVLIAGVIGYRVIEGFSILDSFYMVVITLATVGFNEVHPLSGAGKIFTIILILSSFGIFGYVISTISRFIIDGGFRNYYMLKKVHRMISNTKNHVIVCGYGRNGSQACRELIQHNQPFIVVEAKESVIARIREDNIKLFLQGDATQDSVLERVGVSTAKALITTLPSDADNTFVVLTARHMNPKLTIISRASGHYSDVKLKRAGATNVIMPDKLGGIHMAKLVIQPDVIEFIDNILLQGGNKVRLEEILGVDINACYLGGTIGDLEFRTNSGASIIGIKSSNGEYLYNPSPDEKITCNDKLFVLGTPEQIEKLKVVVQIDRSTPADQL
jgi:voltage-gated potassium channel